LGDVAINLATEVTQWPESATILGSIGSQPDKGVMLGALAHGHGTVVFLSSDSLLFELPQPLTDRVFAFLSGELKVEERPQRGTVLIARRIAADFEPDAQLSHEAWASTEPVQIERSNADGAVHADLATTVRALWSDEYLYLAYEAPYTELTIAERANALRERTGLGDTDVVEALIGGPSRNADEFHQFQVAPNGEWADYAVKDSGEDFDLAWNSGFERVAAIDQQKKVWTAVMRIPLAQLSTEAPESGTRWRVNLIRVDKANDALLAWNPTRTDTPYEPRRFGTLVFEE
jgi:hypothetical protein